MQARLAARGNFAEALRAAVVSAAKNVYGENQQIINDDYVKDEEEASESATHDEGGEKQSTLLKSIANEVIQNTVEVKIARDVVVTVDKSYVFKDMANAPLQQK
jgi:hypothetical protein